MNEKLIEAFFDAPHTVLKRRLRPFTLRHAFVLSAGDNKIVAGGDYTVGDLYQAVEVCSRDASFFFADKPLSKLKRWWWEVRTKKADMLDEFDKFGRYIEDYTPAPAIWAGEGSSKGNAKCDWIISTVAGLMSRLGMSREEAWELSPGEATFYLVAVLESDPMAHMDLMSEAEEAAIAAMKAMEDEEPLDKEGF